MKTLAFLCLLSLLFTGCASSRSREDGFALLHSRVERILAGRCDLGPVTRDKITGRFFEVVPRHSGCRILVFEREFFTQKEWERQYAFVTNQMTRFLIRTNQTKAEAARELAAVEQMRRLPEWSYDGIGVDVDLQTPEVVYPGMEKDQAEARKFFDEIVSLLKPYRANRSAAPNHRCAERFGSSELHRTARAGGRFPSAAVA